MVSDSRSVHMQSDIELPDVPDSYFGNFCSRELLTSITVPFVCCRFSPEISSEGLLALGNEAGVLFIANVEHASSEENLFKRAMFVDVGCVLDVEFIFGRPSYLVAISGHSNVTLWDVDRGISVLRFVAHEGSVRALAVSSDSPDVFATGARDGTIYIWDQREKPKRGMTVEPVSMISSAHLFRPGRTSGASLSASKKRTPSRAKEGPKGITSLAFLDANTLISASTSCQTGILFRDLRYWGSNIPVRTLEYPCSTAKRDFGVTSVCLDRWRSTLFASTTDSFIWEYAINSTKNIPVDVLRGVKRSSVGAFDMKLAASPISDHLTFGSGDRYALLWDLQEKRYFNNHPSSRRDKYYPYPKFVLGGHASEVSLAQFSCSARYIVSMDETTWRLWQFNGSRTEKEIGARPSGFEQVEYYSFQPSQGTSMDVLRGVKRSSVGAFDMKLAASPISDHLTFGSGDRYALLWDLQEKRYFNNHPSSRRDKYYPYPKFVLGGHASEVSLAQFSCSARYIVSMDETTWRLWQFNGSRTEKEIGARPSGERLSLTPTIPLSSKRKTPMASPFKSPFKSGSVARSIDGERSPDKKISKYPTLNLPDWVKDRRTVKIEQQQQHPSPPSTSNQNTFVNLHDYFSPPSPSVSNCSRMVPQAERELQRSPRKLLLKQCLKESGERAQRVGKQTTPHRSRAASRRTPLNRSASTKTPATAKGSTSRTAQSPTCADIRMGKTIKDFFTKKT
ncbi:Denticleless -like protein [Toxocara canis]|uniref:Denticleless-like protein n=2 Tax=Toxocara canis TaxID=6265 RepID=A0A0B2V956_TOXCA|nr:Denticleless -like protein [Toxocara canis]